MLDNILGNSKLFKDTITKNLELETSDEQLLLFKIVKEYLSDTNTLYKLLTKQDRKSHCEIAVEAQPLTPRTDERNSLLDLAMGSIKKRGTTTSGIDLDKDNEEQDFVFCEAKWKSDLSVGVTKCSFRNQLQRVIENALFFAGENFKGNIFVTLITPELYKKHYELGLYTRFYSYKYAEYKGNIKGTFLRELDLIQEANLIPFKNNKNRDIIEKNLDKLILNWVTFEELFEKLKEKFEEIKEIYNEINNKEN